MNHSFMLLMKKPRTFVFVLFCRDRSRKSKKVMYESKTVFWIRPPPLKPRLAPIILKVNSIKYSHYKTCNKRVEILTNTKIWKTLKAFQTIYKSNNANFSWHKTFWKVYLTFYRWVWKSWQGFATLMIGGKFIWTWCRPQCPNLQFFLILCHLGGFLQKAYVPSTVSFILLNQKKVT